MASRSFDEQLYQQLLAHAPERSIDDHILVFSDSPNRRPYIHNLRSRQWGEASPNYIVVDSCTSDPRHVSPESKQLVLQLLSEWFAYSGDATAYGLPDSSADIVSYVLRMLASLLVRGNSGQDIFIVYGPPTNGSSLFFGIVNAMFDSSRIAVAVNENEFFMPDCKDSDSFGKCGYSERVLLVRNFPFGRMNGPAWLNVEKMSGNATVTGQVDGKRLSYRVRGKLLMNTHEEPNLKHCSASLRQRLRLICMLACRADSRERDAALAARVRELGSALMAVVLDYWQALELSPENFVWPQHYVGGLQFSNLKLAAVGNPLAPINKLTKIDLASTTVPAVHVDDVDSGIRGTELRLHNLVVPLVR